MASRGSAACVPPAGCALLLRVAQAGGRLALFAERKVQMHFAVFLSAWLQAKPSPNLCASSPFLT